MFPDILDRLTPCPWHVRAMGFLREAIGIQRRYRRVWRYWREHIDHCQSFILRSIEHCEERRKAVVLGAGLLHDVPLVELSAAFEEVILVDVVHPLSSRWRTRGWRNVKRLAADVTNTLAEVYRVSDEPDLPLPVSRPDLFVNDPRLDLTISLNLLSQLPCMPLAYLEHLRAHPRPKREMFARQLIDAHLDYLKKLPGRACLITDVERLKIDRAGTIVERKDLLYGRAIPSMVEEWEWHLAPLGEVERDYAYHRQVVACSFLLPALPEFR